MIVETIHLEPEEDRADQDENLNQKGAVGAKQAKNNSQGVAKLKNGTGVDFWLLNWNI